LPPPLPSFYRAMPPPPQLHPSTLSHLLRHRSRTSVSEPGAGAVSASGADAFAFLDELDATFRADAAAVRASPAAALAHRSASAPPDAVSESGAVAVPGTTPPRPHANAAADLYASLDVTFNEPSAARALPAVAPTNRPAVSPQPGAPVSASASGGVLVSGAEPAAPCRPPPPMPPPPQVPPAPTPPSAPPKPSHPAPPPPPSPVLTMGSAPVAVACSGAGSVSRPRQPPRPGTSVTPAEAAFFPGIVRASGEPFPGKRGMYIQNDGTPLHARVHRLLQKGVLTRGTRLGLPGLPCDAPPGPSVGDTLDAAAAALAVTAGDAISDASADAPGAARAAVFTTAPTGAATAVTTHTATAVATPAVMATAAAPSASASPSASAVTAATSSVATADARAGAAAVAPFEVPAARSTPAVLHVSSGGVARAHLLEHRRTAEGEAHQRVLKRARKQRKRARAAEGEPDAAAAEPSATDRAEPPSAELVASLRQQLTQRDSLLQSTRKRMRREVRGASVRGEQRAVAKQKEAHRAKTTAKALRNTGGAARRDRQQRKGQRKAQRQQQPLPPPPEVRRHSRQQGQPQFRPSPSHPPNQWHRADAPRAPNQR